jgi:hypothetical protein
MFFLYKTLTSSVFRSILALTFLLLTVNTLQATPNLQGRFVIVTNDASTVVVQFQVLTNTSLTQLAEGNFTFFVDNIDTDLSFSSYTFLGGFASSPYANTVSTGYSAGTISTDEFSINVDDLLSSSGVVISTNSSSWTPVVNITFTTLNSTGSAKFVFDINDMESSAPAMDNEFDQSSNQFTDAGFSPLTMSALPVTLLNFSACLRDNATVLNWTTASEENNAYFTIERSADGMRFDPILTRDGAGNSNKKIDYVAYDENPVTGTSYYRLKQTDFNGKSETFNMVAIHNGTLDNLVINYITLANSGHIPVLNYTIPAEGEVHVTVTDLNGMILYERNLSSSKGENRFSMDDAMAWQPGLYFANLVYNGKSTSYKMIKN